MWIELCRTLKAQKISVPDTCPSSGRPNVGKSTLLNSILGEKIAIVTQKPQTTRNRVIGIKTLPDAQIIFMDTPGIHRPKHRLGETMVRAAMEALNEVDVILFMVEAHQPEAGDKAVIGLLRKVRVAGISSHKQNRYNPEAGTATADRALQGNLRF